MRQTANYEGPGKQCCVRALGVTLDEQQARCVKEQRPFKLIGQVGTDARFNYGPRIGVIRTLANTPDFGGTCDGKKNVEERGKRYVSRHWKYQWVFHIAPVCIGAWSGLTPELSRATKWRRLE